MIFKIAELWVYHCSDVSSNVGQIWQGYTSQVVIFIQSQSIRKEHLSAPDNPEVGKEGAQC